LWPRAFCSLSPVLASPGRRRLFCSSFKVSRMRRRHLSSSSVTQPAESLRRRLLLRSSFKAPSTPVRQRLLCFSSAAPSLKWRLFCFSFSDLPIKCPLVFSSSTVPPKSRRLFFPSSSSGPLITRRLAAARGLARSTFQGEVRGLLRMTRPPAAPRGLAAGETSRNFSSRSEHGVLERRSGSSSTTGFRGLLSYATSRTEAFFLSLARQTS
jgi:hypothetical protein